MGFHENYPLLVLVVLVHTVHRWTESQSGGGLKMADKLKSANILPELRVVLFVVFGIGAWLFLVAGISPANVTSANASEAGVSVSSTLSIASVTD